MYDAPSEKSNALWFFQKLGHLRYDGGERTWNMTILGQVVDDFIWFH